LLIREYPVARTSPKPPPPQNRSGPPHGAGIAEDEVLAQVIAVEGAAGGIGEPLGGDPAPVGVDPEHAPAVAVAHLVDPITTAVGRGRDGHS